MFNKIQKASRQFSELLSKKNLQRITIFVPTKITNGAMKSGVPHFVEHLVYNFLRPKISSIETLELPYTTRKGTFYNFKNLPTEESLLNINKLLFKSHIKETTNISKAVQVERENIMYEKQQVNKNPLNRLFDNIHKHVFSGMSGNAQNKHIVYLAQPVEGTYKDIGDTVCADVKEYYSENYNPSKSTQILYSKKRVSDKVKKLLNELSYDSQKSIHLRNKNIDLSYVKERIFMVKEKDTLAFCKVKSNHEYMIQSVEKVFIDLIINEILRIKLPYIVECFDLNYEGVKLEGIVFNKESNDLNNDRVGELKEEFRNLILNLTKKDVKNCKKKLANILNYKNVIEDKFMTMRLNDLLIDYKRQKTKNIFIDRYKLKDMKKFVRSLTFSDVFNRICEINSILSSITKDETYNI